MLLEQETFSCFLTYASLDENLLCILTTTKPEAHYVCCRSTLAFSRLAMLKYSLCRYQTIAFTQTMILTLILLQT